MHNAQARKKRKIEKLQCMFCLKPGFTQTGSLNRHEKKCKTNPENTKICKLMEENEKLKQLQIVHSEPVEYNPEKTKQNLQIENQYLKEKIQQQQQQIQSLKTEISILKQTKPSQNTTPIQKHLFDKMEKWSVIKHGGQARVAVSDPDGNRCYRLEKSSGDEKNVKRENLLEDMDTTHLCVPESVGSRTMWAMEKVTVGMMPRGVDLQDIGNYILDFSDFEENSSKYIIQWAVVLAVVYQDIKKAIAQLSTKLLVHMDVKEENILLLLQNGEIRANLIDFGYLEKITTKYVANDKTQIRKSDKNVSLVESGVAKYYGQIQVVDTNVYDVICLCRMSIISLLWMNDTFPENSDAMKQHELALDYVIENKDNLGQVYPVWKEILEISKTKKVDWNRKGEEIKMNKFGTDLFDNLMNKNKKANYPTVIYVNK